MELLFKSLLIAEGHKNMRGHDLLKLFKKVSAKQQKALSDEYQRLYLAKKGKVKRFYIRGTKATNSKERFEKSKFPLEESETLEEFLANSKDMFITFRYMFERGRTEEVEYFHFEYGCYNLFCKAFINLYGKGK